LPSYVSSFSFHEQAFLLARNPHLLSCSQQTCDVARQPACGNANPETHFILMPRKAIDLSQSIRVSGGMSGQ
jgi:hypothetical protein